MSEQANTAGREAFQAEFEALPLDEKFARLFKLELATLGDAARKVEESGAKFFESAGEVLSDLGKRADAEWKKATCGTTAEKAAPAESPSEASEHQPESKESEGN